MTLSLNNDQNEVNLNSTIWIAHASDEIRQMLQIYNASRLIRNVVMSMNSEMLHRVVIFITVFLGLYREVKSEVKSV